MSKRDVVFPPGRQALYEKNRYSPAADPTARRNRSWRHKSGSRSKTSTVSSQLLAARSTMWSTSLVFVVDPEANFDTVWKVLPEYWGEAPYPTLTGVGVTWLYGFHFEIKVIAKLPSA